MAIAAEEGTRTAAPPADETVDVSRLVAVTSSRTLVFEHATRDATETVTCPPPAETAPLRDAAIAAPREEHGKANGTSRREIAVTDSTRYSMLGLLGRGAMGEVLIARDEDLLRKVAFKRMAPGMLEHPLLAARFFNEAQVTAQLDHPHIVPVYGVEVGGDGMPGYSMKLVQGRTLTAILDEAAAKLDGATKDDVARGLAERLELFLKVCDAMDFAHGKGVLHRDLKPDNVMVGRYNEVYVMDWGICRLLHAAEAEAPDEAIVVSGETTAADRRTQIGAVMGTPLYMSPEQALGDNASLDARSDLYALGLILYEIVSLKRARGGDTLTQVLAQAASGAIPAIEHRDARFGVPRELRAIVARATAVAREDRYGSVRELADEIRRFLRGEAVRASPDTRYQSAARWIATNRSRALAGMATILLVAAGALISSLLHEQLALARAAARERTTQRFLSLVQEQAHAIDERIYRDERILAELASAASEALAHADPKSDVKVYTSEDFASPTSAPADLAPSKFYRRPISLEWPVIKLAPGVDRKSVDREVRILGLLRPALVQAIEAGIDEDDRLPAALHAHFAKAGGEIARAFVSTESGIHASYPGVAGFQADYDPRQRPKYLLAAHQKGLRWGNPYYDPFGLGMMLPASTALYGPDGQFLGVAGIVTTFENIRETLLPLQEEPNVDEAMLVDGDGDIVTTMKARDPAFVEANPPDNGDADAPVNLVPLRYPSARNAIRAGRSGFLDVETENGRRIVALYRLSSLGWYYVVVADRVRLTPAAATLRAGAPIGQHG